VEIATGASLSQLERDHSEARHQVREFQQEHPRFTDDRIRALWSVVRQSAVNEAEGVMNQVIHNVPELTWEEVFETSYEMEKRPS
jgi:hypothetical protein